MKSSEIFVTNCVMAFCIISLNYYLGGYVFDDLSTAGVVTGTVAFFCRFIS